MYRIQRKARASVALNYTEIVRTGLSRQVAEAIRSAILEGRLQVDDRLPSEDELARRFGVSRPTVREALKVLAAQNLIWSRRGPTGGNFISQPDPEGLSRAITDAATLLVAVGVFAVDEMVNARLETESLCCRMAAANHGAADIAAMQAEIDLQQQEGLSDEDFCASDVRFHRALVGATANGPMRLMMYTVIESFIPITNMLIFPHRERARATASHQKILNAIAARDGEAAAQLMRGHLEGMRAELTGALSRRATPKDPTPQTNTVTNKGNQP
jgi:GntR family transcriptional regulator, transcriptional repressor for pyruvate dehydrogenase complex